MEGKHKADARQLRPRYPRLAAALFAWLALIFMLALQLSGTLSFITCKPPAGQPVRQHALQGDAGSSSTGGSSGGGDGSGRGGSTAGGSGTASTASTRGSPGPTMADRLQTWQKVDALIRQPAQLHGQLRKGGLPANWPTLLSHMTNMRAELHGIPDRGFDPAIFNWFGRLQGFNKSAGHSNAGLQSPVPSCHWYVDHRYRLVYVRATKTAGTSIIETLGMKENPMVCRSDPSWCLAKCRGKQVCLAYMFTQEEVRRVWKDYTVFSFVRNPWVRAISSWHHIHKLGIRPECQDPFHKFAELPSAYGAKCLTTYGCCRQRFGWILEHLEPQAPCLFDAEGKPSVDFIGRVEHVEEDLQALLDLANRRRPMGTEPLHIKSLPHLMVTEQAKDGEEALHRAYAQLYLNSTALEDVLSYYRQDFQQLHFPHTL